MCIRDSPKDGPSAGVTLFLALASLLKGVGAPPDVALTGEITLRGTVLPVGGIKEKIIAAHRAGIKVVYLPERNEKDLADVPEQALKELEIRLIKRVDEIMPLIELGGAKKPGGSGRRRTEPAPREPGARENGAATGSAPPAAPPPPLPTAP